MNARERAEAFAEGQGDPALSAAGLALGILTGQEPAEDQGLLWRHPQAREQARASGSVVDLLQHAGQTAIPTAELRRDVLARITDTPRLH